MGNIKERNSQTLKRIADEFNNLSDYEKYVKTHKKNLDRIYESCMDVAKRGCYRLITSATFHHESPDKEHIVKYFKELGFKPELYEAGLIQGEKHEPTKEELQRAPYRYYTLVLNWE
jgi:hypothetical protein